MGNINWLAVVLGAVAFFAVGAIWYTVLFGKAWQAAVGLSDEQLKTGANMPLIFGTCLLLELLVALTVGHIFDYTQPNDRSKMMISVGLAVGIMAPAIGICYLYMRKPFKLWLIDSGHFIFGMAALGGVFALLD